MGIIAIAIFLDSPGSPYFVQTRVGKFGRRFRFYKFRTMPKSYDQRIDREFMQAYIAGQIESSDQVNKEAVNKPVKKENITRIGRILRKSSLDEVPQIINVLKGEMSFIGPRPNVPWEVEKYEKWHCKRLEVLPGITGLAQVRGRSNIPFDEIVNHDIEYVQNQSLILDLKILLWTVQTVFSSRGAG